MDDEVNNEAESVSYPSHSVEEINQLILDVHKELDELRQLLLHYLGIINLPKQPLWLTSIEVQNHLRVSKLTLKRYRENRVLRYITLKGRFRYHSSDVYKLSVKSVKFNVKMQ